jgi:hypothetical protein
MTWYADEIMAVATTEALRVMRMHPLLTPFS